MRILYYYSESFKLGDKGVEYLSKAKWPNLARIDLSTFDNSVGKGPIKDPQKAEKRFMQDPIRIRWN